MKVRITNKIKNSSIKDLIKFYDYKHRLLSECQKKYVCEMLRQKKCDNINFTNMLIQSPLYKLAIIRLLHTGKAKQDIFAEEVLILMDEITNMANKKGYGEWLQSYLNSDDEPQSGYSQNNYSRPVNRGKRIPTIYRENYYIHDSWDNAVKIYEGE